MKFDLKNENEIGLNDIASESDKKDLEFGKFKRRKKKSLHNCIYVKGDLDQMQIIFPLFS
jgi:hypothetical protein